MTGRTFRVFGFLALAAFASAPAGATVLDFEGIPDDTPITNQFPGVAFANARAIASGSSLNDLEFPPRSGTVVVFDDGGPMTILFGAPQASVAAFFTYTVPITLTAFDAGDAVLAPDTSDFASNLLLSGEIGSIPNELLAVASAGGIARVVIEGDPFGGSFTLDDLTVVPLAAPAPLALLLLGVALSWARATRLTRFRRGGRHPRAGAPGEGVAEEGRTAGMERRKGMRNGVVGGLGLLMWLLTQGIGPGPAEGAVGGGVRVNGNPVPGAESILDIKVEVLEFREGGQQGVVHLTPGPKRYAVSIVLPGRIQIFDNELPVPAEVHRFTVQADDGRIFTDCLVAGLTSPGAGPLRRHVYALRCENVSE